MAISTARSRSAIATACVIRISSAQRRRRIAWPRFWRRGHADRPTGGVRLAHRHRHTRMRIGPHVIDPPLILAPMAGVTDKPFRLLCKRLGAGYAVSEMTTADPRLWHTRKSARRLDHEGEPAP